VRFATYYDDNGHQRCGVATAGSLVPFTDAVESPHELIEMGIEAATMLPLAHEMALPLSDARIGPSVPEPRNIICVGRNYPLHAAEEGVDIPEVPLLFSKHTSTIRGPFDHIEWDASLTRQVDWEAEMGVVIGRPTRRVSAEDALDYVFGYTACNDVSARDIQFSDGQWLRGKSLDSFLPTGPVIVSPDEVGDPQSLALECRVNGVVKQTSSTAEMYHSVAEIISFCSQSFTLLPGDLILTGTPGGVGVFRDPPEFLSHGDVVEVEIERIGLLRNECLVRGR
jgi:2-keto-4-pentenoate hydratase/2-oxohepta-3-ene-1,7-dioic acid hydratase in catechol pathway